MQTHDAGKTILGRGCVSACASDQRRLYPDLTAGSTECDRQQSRCHLLDEHQDVEPPDHVRKWEAPEGAPIDQPDTAGEDPLLRTLKYEHLYRAPIDDGGALRWRPPASATSTTASDPSPTN